MPAQRGPSVSIFQKKWAFASLCFMFLSFFIFYYHEIVLTLKLPSPLRVYFTSIFTLNSSPSLPQINSTSFFFAADQWKAALFRQNRSLLLWIQRAAVSQEVFHSVM